MHSGRRKSSQPPAVLPRMYEYNTTRPKPDESLGLTLECLEYRKVSGRRLVGSSLAFPSRLGKQGPAGWLQDLPASWFTAFFHQGFGMPHRDVPMVARRQGGQYHWTVRMSLREFDPANGIGKKTALHVQARSLKSVQEGTVPGWFIPRR